VVGNGVLPETIVEGQPIYGSQWEQAPVDSQGYRTNYPSEYGQGYKVDRDGYRIIHEDPLPPGARSAN
jgi:hypothetical protein